MTGGEALVEALGRYATLWRVPGAPVLLVLGLFGRLGVSMMPLGLLLLVQSATGQYALAAVAAAAFPLAAAAASPLMGRIADRVGPSPVLIATAAGHPVGLALVIGSARAGHPDITLIVLAAVLSGATYPPLVAFLRGAWVALTEPDGSNADLRGTALATDTSIYQCVFVVGPLLAAALVAIGSPSLVIAASGGATVVGTLTIACGRAMRSSKPRARTSPGHGPGPLRVAGFPALLACSASVGTAFGVVTVAVPAFATAHGSAALAGVLLAMVGTGSVIGGVCFGAVRLRASLPRQFALLLAGLATGYAILAAMPRVAPLAVALLLGGGFVAPVLTVESALVGRAVPAGIRTEAYAWIASLEIAASAAGIQVAGLIVDQPGGLPWAFLTAALAVCPGAIIAAMPNGPIAHAIRAA